MVIQKKYICLLLSWQILLIARHTCAPLTCFFLLIIATKHFGEIAILKFRVLSALIFPDLYDCRYFGRKLFWQHCHTDNKSALMYFVISHQCHEIYGTDLNIYQTGCLYQTWCIFTKMCMFLDALASLDFTLVSQWVGAVSDLK